MKILDISVGVAGAYCAQLLSLTGADVIRLRLHHPELAVSGDVDDFYEDLLDRGKVRTAVDLERADQRMAVLNLVAQADAVIEDHGPGKLEAVGLGEADLRASRTALVFTRISEFGQTGPWSNWAGSELVNLATGGLLFLTGSWDRPPVQLAPFQAQLTTGLIAAIVTTAAVYGGAPVTIDVSKQEVVASLITTALTEYEYSGIIPGREGRAGNMTRIERSKDGWVYAGPASPSNADYRAFAGFLGIPELAAERFSTPERRMAHWEEHQSLIVPKLKEKSTREWVEAAAEWRFTFAYVQDTVDLLNCPVLGERDFFTAISTCRGVARTGKAPYLVNGERPTPLAKPVAHLEVLSDDACMWSAE